MNKLTKLILNPFFWLTLILFLGFFVRLYKIDNPIADWHSWRQADTAAVARNFYKEGYNPFVPKYDDMSAVSDGFGFNLGRYRFAEFPIYQSLVYFGYLLNGGVDEKIARIINVFFSLGSCVFIFLITKKYFSKITALIASFLYAFLPFNVYFSRTTLPEPSLVFFSLGMFYFTDRWILHKTKTFFFLGGIFGALAFLIKPMAIFYVLPLIYLFFTKEKSIFKVSKIYFFYLLAIFLPLALWRIWINQHPEGIPASNWLFNGNGIRFRPAFWRWIINDRLGREILSIPGTILLVIGLLIKPTGKENLLLHLLAISSFLYLIVFATGNVQHDYYQYMIVPALVIFVARGFVSLFRGIPIFLPRIMTIPLAFLFFVLIFILTTNEVKGLYQINNPAIVIAGQKADQLLPKNAVVIAPYFGDTAFLYQTNRYGFPYTPLAIDELITRFKTTSYVSVTYDAKTKWLMKKYTVLDATPLYVIIDLTKINPDFYKNVKSADDLKEPL
ncbi:glycosyltransferase family 39 protein [Candidatus Daviesbacteria bacterium]|nr:glycosyltransferase family 39 protein [Candidatus Daviesbacteria bacterium]